MNESIKCIRWYMSVRTAHKLLHLERQRKKKVQSVRTDEVHCSLDTHSLYNHYCSSSSVLYFFCCGTSFFKKRPHLENSSTLDLLSPSQKSLLIYKCHHYHQSPGVLN
ncbi:hypothetical protein MGS_03657 [Candida albicans P78042]|nr:hypothetical protein MGS_03657 [Candida albicans P78042]